MKNFIICIKKEILELIKNKKFIFFLFVVCIAGFIAVKKNLVELSLLFIAVVA